MKEIKLPDLPVRSASYDGYHAKVAFSKITTESVNYKILKAIDITENVRISLLRNKSVKLTLTRFCANLKAALGR